MSNAGQCAENALWVEGDGLAKGFFVVHVVGAQHSIVDLSYHIFERELVAVAQSKDYGISHQYHTYHPRDKLLPKQHHTQRAKEVAQCQALEHAQIAH